MMAPKTDNHNPQIKLDLRRYMLRKYHATGLPVHVLDCCQGSGVLWRTLRKEFTVDSYWGLDLKPQKGRLNLDSVRVLAQPSWPQNVIDIDTYGAPWKHWFALLANLDHEATVFLTIGQKVTGTVGKMSKAAIGAIGAGSLYKTMPPAFHVKLAKMCVTYCLAKSYDYGIMATGVVEAISDNRNVRYVGVHLIPSKRAATAATATAQAQEGKFPCKA